MLSTLPAAEFPFLDEISEGHRIELTQETLKHLFDRTHFAMAHQDVRYYLNGLLVVLTPERVRAVATDGHRLALCDASVNTGVSEALQVIVPRKAITELQRLLGNNDSSLQLTISDNHLQVQLADIRFTTKLIDGRFPDYERVIPTEGDKKIIGERELVRQALSRTAILSNEKFKGVRLVLEENRLKLQAQNPDHEEAEDEIEVSYNDGPLEIGFNVNYLMDALAVMETEQFSLELTGPDSSGLLREHDGGDSQYVVMPMRL
jgi:DNA polymerase-3 subunit beta